jgi:hypothetical protein
MSEENDKSKGRQDNMYMSIEAWDYLNELVSRQPGRPKRGRGRIIEDILLEKKAKEEKKKMADSSDKPAA